MSTKITVNPFTKEEVGLIQYIIAGNELSMCFFGFIFITLNGVLSYGIYKSNDSLEILFILLLIIGLNTYIFFEVKVLFLENRRCNNLIEKNEKYLREGYVENKDYIYFRYRNVTVNNHYIIIDKVEHHISKKSYDEISVGDYVNYEEKDPLQTEILKIVPRNKR